MKKILKRSLTILVSSLMLTSCTPPLWFIKDDTGSNNYKDRQQLVFTHLWQRGSTNYTEINNLIKKFNESDIAKELNVYVKGDGINFWDYWTKVDLSISGGNAPDIFIHAVSSTPTRINQLLNLTDMHDDDVANGRDTLDENKMFFPSQINDISRYAPDGKSMHAWPFSSTVRVIYYNKDLFKEAGITETPKTWAELDAVSEKLTKYNTPGDVNSGYAQVGFDPFTSEGQYIHQWGWLANHSFFTEDSNGRPVPHFNDSTLIENLNKVYSSYVRRDDKARENLQKFMSKEAANSKNPFLTQKLAMVISNEGLYTTLKEANVDFEYGVFEIPPMDESCNYVNWSSSYSIELFDNSKRSNTSDKVAEQRNRGTWEFLKYMYQEEFQEMIANAGFMLSNRTFYDKFIYNDPIKTDLANAIANTREAEFIKAVPNWTSDIQTYVNSIYSYPNGKSVEEAMNNAQKLIISKIDQYYSVNGK